MSNELTPESASRRQLDLSAFAASFGAVLLLFPPACTGSVPGGQVVSWGEVVVPYVAPETTFTNIVAGAYNSAALTRQGTVVEWGNNRYGAATPPAGLNNVKALAVGNGATLALRTDGSVAGWGYLRSGAIGVQSVPPGLSNIIAVAQGGVSVALKADGTVWTWTGSGPLASEGVSNIVGIAASTWQEGLALANDGSVFYIGIGQPYQHRGPGNVVAIAAGDFHIVYLLSDGTVTVDSYGPNPFTAPAVSNVVAIAAGANHDLALKADGTVVAWGDDSYGQTNVPPGLSNVVAIAAGQAHSLALTQDGTVEAWGSCQYAETAIPGALRDIIAVSPVYDSTLLLRQNGTLVTWGNSESGPVPSDLSNVVAIAAADLYCLALKQDGTVAAWGSDYTASSTGSGPLDIPTGLSNVVAIATGLYHGLALKTDGTVVAWGDDSYGQTNVPAGLSNAVAITAKWYDIGSEALRNDGTLVTWPSQPAWMAGLTGVMGLARGAGDANGLLVLTNGTVIAWGDDSSGQTNVPAGLTSVVAAAAGRWHNLALRRDGTVAAWGANVDPEFPGMPFYGQATVPEGLSNVVAIAAGHLSSLAIRTEPLVASLSLSSGTPTIRFYAQPGQSYSVEYSPDLHTGNWLPLPNGVIAGNGQRVAIADATPATQGPRFYRVRLEQ